MLACLLRSILTVIADPVGTAASRVPLILNMAGCCCWLSSSHAMQGHYCLGVALRHQVRYKDSCMHLEKALSAAFEVQDSIKDSIWRELAACKHAFWEQQATVRADKRQRLQTRMGMFMDFYFSAHPDVCFAAFSPCLTVCVICTEHALL
jgi:hypothetical protein